MGSATDIGRVRALNEDACFVGRGLYAVIDGMGGHAAGDVASQLAAQTLARADAPVVPENQVRSALAMANQHIVQHGLAHPESRGLGCTIAGIARGEHAWWCFHVGDSRVYRWRSGLLTQVTRDHSEVQELIDAGLLTPDQARSHPARNVVTRALGEDPAAEVELQSLALEPGDCLVLATDGLTGEVDDAGIASILGGGGHPQEVASALVRAAVDAGGRDNVSVVVITVDSVLPSPPESTTVPRGLIEREAAS